MLKPGDLTQNPRPKGFQCYRDYHQSFALSSLPGTRSLGFPQKGLNIFP